jgi:hypothetical protein
MAAIKKSRPANSKKYKVSAKTTQPIAPRVRKTPSHHSFRLSKKIKHHKKPLPSAYSLIKQSLGLFKSNRKLFWGIVAINVVLGFIFVQSFGSSTDFTDLKDQIESLVGQGENRIATSLALFSYALSTLGQNGSETAGMYKLFLLLITSLAVIWSVRQIAAGEKVSAKEAFYKGMYPMVPFLLVMFVIGLQLIPALLGNLLYSAVSSNDLAVTAPEKVVWVLIYGLLSLLSIYMVLSSLFALYIVTLPNMTPMKALRSARQLVLHRRIAVSLRLIALPIIMVFLSALIIIPLILIASWSVQVVFSILASIGLVLIHGYLYNLYRALL